MQKDTKKVMLLKTKLEALVSYYKCTHRVGHTYATLGGLNSSPRAHLVVQHYIMGLFISPIMDQIISLDDLEKLQRLHAPIVWDNKAIDSILRDSLEAVNILLDCLHEWENAKA